jgi:hypothetical protein
MSAIFVRPAPFTPGTSTTPLAGSVANLGNDHPGLVWRAGVSSYIVVDLGTGASYDHVGLFGSNLRDTDTVQIRTGTASSGIGNYAGTAIPAFIGFKDDAATSKAIFKLPTTRSERFVRIDLSAPSHPDGYVQFSRLVIGTAVSSIGISFDAEHGFEGQSVITTGPGYRSVDAYAPLDSWKFSTGWITDTSWRSEWAPMMRHASAGGGLMMIVDDAAPTNWQTDAVYGHLSGTASGKAEAFNKWRVESKITAYSR